MSSQLCIDRTWGRERTHSVGLPHPWLESLKKLAGGAAGDVDRYLVQSSQSQLRAISALPDDWDGAGSARPRAASVANASARLLELCRLAMLAGTWKPPHISASEFGDVTFEWWDGRRKLTIYFGDEDMEVLRVWGANIESEMQHRQIVSAREIAADWAWLNGD